MKKTTGKRKKEVSPVMVQIEALAKKVEPSIRHMWRSRMDEGVSLLPERGTINPLLELPDETRSKLFDLMRVCPYTDTALQMLEEQGVTDVLPLHLEGFFESEGEHQWEVRCLRATQEANSLMKAVEKHVLPYDPATLQALQQQIFHLIASSQADPATIARMGTLFLKVRGNMRAEENHELRQEKFRRELQGQIDLALEKLAEEVDKHPATRSTFDALRQELATSLAQVEEEEA
jgi:hypothetical protein